VNIAYLVRRAAASHPHSVAVDDGRTCRTLSELAARAERLANALDELGISPGGAVGILSENRTEFVEVDVALAFAGRVRVALNARLHLEDFALVVADAGLEALVYSDQKAEEAHALAERFGVTLIAMDGDGAAADLQSLINSGDSVPRIRAIPDEAPAWITYTSGTTGKPKGIVLSHRAIREVAFNLLLELSPVVPGEQIVLTQAISHASGYFVLPYLLSGAGVYLMRKFDPAEAWSLSSRPNIRTLKAVPAMLEPLLDAESGEWGFDTILYGASSVPQPVLERSLERFGPSLLQDYGQSEAPITITCLSKHDHLDAERRLSAGRPWRSVGVEVRRQDGSAVSAGELGEVYVSGAHMMTGYHNRPDLTAQAVVDGWLRTHDLAKVDDRGFIYLQGRSDEMINSGGYNIAPREVEDALVTLQGVGEVVVLGLPDPAWGEMVTAVVRRSGELPLEIADITEYARARLGMRAPKRIEIWDEIPRTPYGKVDRVGVRKKLDENGSS
jgi:fatty-acyl-CoA synthase